MISFQDILSPFKNVQFEICQKQQPQKGGGPGSESGASCSIITSFLSQDKKQVIVNKSPRPIKDDVYKMDPMYKLPPKISSAKSVRVSTPKLVKEPDEQLLVQGQGYKYGEKHKSSTIKPSTNVEEIMVVDIDQSPASNSFDSLPPELIDKIGLELVKNVKDAQRFALASKTISSCMAGTIQKIEQEFFKSTLNDFLELVENITKDHEVFQFRMVFKRYNTKTEIESYIVASITYSSKMPTVYADNDSDDDDAYEQEMTTIQVKLQHFQQNISISESDISFNFTKDLVDLIYDECLTFKPNGNLTRIEIIDFSSKPLDTCLVETLSLPLENLKQYNNALVEQFIETRKEYFELKESCRKTQLLMDLLNNLLQLEKSQEQLGKPVDILNPNPQYDVIDSIIKYMRAREQYSSKYYYKKDTRAFDEAYLVHSFHNLNEHDKIKLNFENFRSYLDSFIRQFDSLNTRTPTTTRDIIVFKYHERKAARALKIKEYLDQLESRDNLEIERKFVEEEFHKNGLDLSFKNLVQVAEEFHKNGLDLLPEDLVQKIKEKVKTMKSQFEALKKSYQIQFQQIQELRKLHLQPNFDFEKHCKSKIQPRRN
jgi:hypothetical protein